MEILLTVDVAFKVFLVEHIDLLFEVCWIVRLLIAELLLKFMLLSQYELPYNFKIFVLS